MNLLHGILFVIAGVGAGAISTSFGIGGGALSTPAIRALGTSALMSIGTTLPPVLPGVITGIIQYRGKGLIRYDVALAVSIPGAIAAVGGSLISHHLPGNGHVIMLITAGVLLLNAIRLAQSPKANPNVPEQAENSIMETDSPSRDDISIGSTQGSSLANQTTPKAVDTKAVEAKVLPDVRVQIKGHYLRLVYIGMIAGLISGGLGLGGGIVLVPVFARKVGLSLRESTATSLVCIGLLAIPSIITHSFIGDINWTVAALLTIGTIPGAHIGAKLSMRASDIWLRRSASSVLSVIAVTYALTELLSITHL